MTIQRPSWANTTPEMQDYYDHYWGFPVHDDHQLFEMLSLELFQAGLSWQTIWQRRAAFQRAFANFEINKVAAFTANDIERLYNDQTIIRNRLKIMAVINNARVIQHLQQAGQSFDEYLWHFVAGKPQRLIISSEEDLPTQTSLSRQIAHQMKADGFKFVGPTIIYSLMTAVGLVNARWQSE